MNTFRCVIIDDEQSAISMLTYHISQHTDLELVKSYSNPSTALAEIHSEDKIDIIFMDIEMPDISGIELARRLRNKTNIIIFTSAHPEYVWEAFDIPVMHFLVKPVKYSKFVTTVQTAMERFLEKSMYREDGVIFVSCADKTTRKVSLDDIRQIKAARNYIKIETTGEPLSAKMTMWEAEKVLLGTKLMRIHRSHMVNIDLVDRLIGNSIILKSNEMITVGDDYKEIVGKYFSDLKL